MYPVNQVILGGDPMMASIDDIDVQIQRMEAYRKRLQEIKNVKPQQQVKLIWDDIDAEINPLTDEQKSKLFEDEDYAQNYMRLQALVQAEIINLVKGQIENTTEGKELLQNQLKHVRRLKGKIINDSNLEMEVFRKFKEYSKTNPGITYEEFIKTNI